MSRIYIKDLRNHIGEEVSVSGWVDVRRDQGKLIFLDIRDVSGTVQSVVGPNASTMEVAKSLRPEWVVEMSGKVNERRDKNINIKEENGNLELEVLSVSVLNRADTPAIDVRSDGREIGEEHRLKYRYLDLRRPRMYENLKMRYRVAKFIRDFLDQEKFLEIETPYLTRSTPEGARDFLVPSRMQPAASKRVVCPASHALATA